MSPLTPKEKRQARAIIDMVMRSKSKHLLLWDGSEQWKEIFGRKKKLSPRFRDRLYRNRSGCIWVSLQVFMNGPAEAYREFRHFPHPVGGKAWKAAKRAYERVHENFMKKLDQVPCEAFRWPDVKFPALKFDGIALDKTIEHDRA